MKTYPIIAVISVWRLSGVAFNTCCLMCD